MQWTPPWILLAEETHFLLGLLFVFGGQILVHSALAGAVGILVLGTVKEFAWDLRIEKSTWKDGAKDMAFYVLGILVAGALVALA